MLLPSDWPFLFFSHLLALLAGSGVLLLVQRPWKRRLLRERERQIADNARHKRLHDNMPGIVYQTLYTPEKGQLTTYISDGVRHYGVTPEEIYEDANSLMRLVHPDDSLRLHIALTKSRQHLTIFHEEYRILHSGTTSWVESRAIPTREANGSTVWDGMLVDITTRKQAESALKDSEQKLKLMAMALANNGNGVLIAEVTGREQSIVYTNPAFTEITGYRQDETLDRHMLFLYEQEGHSNNLQRLHQITGRGESCRMLLPTHRKDGSLFWNNLSITPIHDHFGEVSHYVAVFNDVTELENARLTAEKATAIKRDFLANMSHEIRTPLYGILGTVEVMNNSHLSPEQKQWVNILKQTGNSLFALISDILDFSKIETGTLRLTQAPFSPQELAEEVLQLLQQSAHEKGLSLELKVGRHIPARLTGDRDRIQQIINNYLVNAIKFTNKGNIVLSVSCTRVRKDSQTVDVRFSVRDRGIGIPQEQQQAIFDKFTQADTSANRRFGGAGLGLAICKQLAELMGGGVGVGSTLGKGSTFWCEVPLSIAAAAPLPQDTAAAPLPSFSGKRALLAEDNPINRTVTAAMLQKLGLDVSVAEDGKQALDAFRNASFDLVLMDIQMPLLSGFEASSAIRALEASSGRRTPIIAFTANVLEGFPQECIDNGMDDYLSKPVRLEQLARKLQRYLTTENADAAPARRIIKNKAKGRTLRQRKQDGVEV